MATTPLNKVPWGPDKASKSPILAEWIKASSFFYANHKTLSDYLSSYTNQQATSPRAASPFVKQCSIEELVSLLALMRQELITLLRDISMPIEGMPVTPQINEQLTIHVSRLNRLNQRAQAMIELFAN